MLSQIINLDVVDCEKLVISNSNDDATAIEDPKTISYRERNNVSAGSLATVWDWTLRQRRYAAMAARESVKVMLTMP